MKKEHSDEKNAHNITGGGAYVKPDRLIDKHECFHRLADAISLSIKGLKALPGEEGYQSTSACIATGSQLLSTTDDKMYEYSRDTNNSPDLFGFPDEDEFVHYSTVVVEDAEIVAVADEEAFGESVPMAVPLQSSSQ